MIETRKKLKISLPERIADELRYRILTKEIQKNEFFNENALSEQYGVSRGSIRQAIMQLSAEGLVEPLPNGRTKVTGFSAAEMQDYCQIRLFLESEAMKKIVRFPDDDRYHQLIQKLSDLADEIGKLRPQFDYEIINQLDMEFHFAIMDVSGSQIPKQIWKSLANINKTFLFIRKMLSDHNPLFDDDIETTVSSHRRIIEYLSTRDLEKLLDELQWHIRHSIQIYTKVLENLSYLRVREPSEQP